MCDLAVDERECKLFAKMKFSGTHVGPLLGQPPTHKHVFWFGSALFTIREGKIEELWVLGDVQGLLSQIAQQNKT